MSSNRTSDSPLYDLHQLEAYLRQKQRGQLNAEYEQVIANDDFLQTAVAELEQQLREAPNAESSIAERLERRKAARWPQIEAAMANYAPSSPSEMGWGESLRQTWRELQYTQFQYLLGFNCVCIFAILFVSLWIHQQGGDQIDWIATVESGFKY